MIPLLQPSIDGLRAFLLEKNCFISWSVPTIEKILKEYITAGKCIRGGLLVHLLGKKNSSDALILGAALELAQSALIIQDDIMDHDELRRGKPSLHIELSQLTNSNDAGINLALCIADYLLFTSQELLSSIKNTSIIPSLSRYWNEQLKRVSIGQYCDIQYSSNPIIPSVKEIRVLYENKTSSYSFCIPILTRAIFEDATDKTKTILEDIANDLGTLYQLSDDMLNVYGDSSASGKPTESDIREKKKTLLVSLAYEASDADERKKLMEYFGSTKFEDFSSIATLMNSTKIEQKIDNETHILKDSIKQSLTDPLISSDIKDTLHSLLDFIVTRTV